MRDRMLYAAGDTSDGRVSRWSLIQIAERSDKAVSVCRVLKRRAVGDPGLQDAHGV